MPPVVAVGAALGAAAVHVGAMTLFQAVVGVGSLVYQDRQARKAKAEFERALSAQNTISGYSETINLSTAPREFVYGEGVRKSGSIIFDHVDEQNTNNRYMIICIADHDIFWGDNELMIDGIKCKQKLLEGTWRTVRDAEGGDNQFTNKFFFNFRASDAGYPGVLVEEIPDYWTTEHTLSGMSCLICKMVFDQNVFSARPQISLWIDGKACYDPRTGTNVRTQNPAIALLDYLKDTTVGMGFSDAEIDVTSFIQTANLCDTNNWSIHGVVSTTEDHSTIINKFLDACAGRLVFAAGKLFLRGGAWRIPVLELDESDLRGPIAVSWRRKRSELFNTVRGVFIDPEEGEASEYPTVKDAALISADGGELPLSEADFEMVNSADQCQELSTILLKRNRREISARITVSLKAFYDSGQKIMPFDTFYFSFAKYGWDRRTFEILSWKLDIQNGAPVVHLDIAETDAAIYDAITPASYNPALKTNLPSPSTIAAPATLSVTEVLKGVGDIYNGWAKLQWDIVSDVFLAGYQVRYKLGSNDWISAGNFEANSIELPLDEPGNYVFAVRSINRYGVNSAWTEHSIELLGKIAPPSDVTGLSGQLVSGGYLLRWNPVPDFDLFEYSIRQGWTTPPDGPFFFTRAKSTEFLSPYLVLPDGVDEVGLLWTVWAVDTSNIFSVNAAAHEFTVRRPEPPQNFTCQAVGSKVIMNWDEPATTYPITRYRVFRKKSSGGYLRLAEVNASYFIQEEFAAGQYIYAVMAYDAAGNASAMTEIASAITVLAPKGFVDKISLDRPLWGLGSDWADGIRENQTPPGGLTSCDYSPAELGLPPLENPEDRYLIPGIRPKNETVDEWIAATGYQSAQDAIDDGCVYAIEPMSEETYKIMFGWGSNDPARLIDIGHNVRLGAIRVELVEAQRSGGDAAIESPRHLATLHEGGGLQTFATNDFYASNFGKTEPGFLYKSSKHSIVILSRLKMNLAIALEDYGGTAEGFAADASGTFIEFPQEMNAIESLTATLKAPSTAVNIIIEPEAATPITGMYVFAFDAAGDRTDCEFYWTMRGY
jgi:hypothetical protein